MLEISIDSSSQTRNVTPFWQSGHDDQHLLSGLYAQTVPKENGESLRLTGEVIE